MMLDNREIRNMRRNRHWLIILMACLCLVMGCSSSPEPPMIGKAAPNFSFRRLDGTVQDLQQFHGKVVLIRFWADWCHSCLEEMPIMERYFHSVRGKGFTMLAINVKQPGTRVADFVQNHELSYPVGLDEDGTITAAYRVKGIPSHFLIDRKGILREVYLGPFGRESVLADMVRRYLQE